MVRSGLGLREQDALMLRLGRELRRRNAPKLVQQRPGQQELELLDVAVDRLELLDVVLDVVVAGPVLRSGSGPSEPVDTSTPASLGAHSSSRSR